MARCDVEFAGDIGETQVFLVVHVDPAEDFGEILAHGVGAFVEISGIVLAAHDDYYLAQDCAGKNLVILFLERNLVFHFFEEAFYDGGILIAELNERFEFRENLMNVVDVGV